MTRSGLAAVATMLLGLVPAAQLHAGVLEDWKFDSPALGREVPATVYRPDRAAGPMPTLYLLHGNGGDASDWTNAGVLATADAVFAEPGAVPMLIVMPGAGNSWYVNSDRYGAWNDAIARDLVDAVDTRFPTERERGRRFVAGLSMGGYGALQFAVHHPDRFRAAAALSPAIFEDVGDAGDFPDFQIGFFAGAFGDPLQAADFNARNVFAPLASLRNGTGGLPTDFYLMTGDHDSLGLWRGTLRFFQAAREAGHHVELRVRDGDHEWRLWRDELAPVLRWVGGIVRADRGTAQ